MSDTDRLPAVMMPGTTPDELRARAAQHDRERHESFDRCDTDGALSQWASGITAQKDRLEAQLLEQGGLAQFPALFRLDGTFQPAYLFDDRFGNAKWMLLDENGDRTGEYLPFAPARRETHEKRGYVEGWALWPAYVKMIGQTLTAVRPIFVRKGANHLPPAEIVTTDRGYRSERNRD